MLEHIRDYYVGRNIAGVYVAPDPLQIDETGTDLRPADQPDLRILITTGIVTELRTLASGERIPCRKQLIRVRRAMDGWLSRGRFKQQEAEREAQ